MATKVAGVASGLSRECPSSLTHQQLTSALCGAPYLIGSDTGRMNQLVERHHWINTIVGTLDQAFYLTDEEQFYCIDIVSRLLKSLDIPDRSEPTVLPTPVVLEMTSAIYSTQLAGPRVSGVIRPIRATVSTDIVVSIEAWVQALLAMLTTAYPDLDPTERMVTAKVLTDLLDAIGVPDRAAMFYPDNVVRVSNDLDR